MCREFVQESDVEAEDRVEIFFSASKDMGQYYCMEIDPSGHVMDYSASYYRKFDYEWNFKSLEICSIKDEKRVYRCRQTVCFRTFGIGN